MVTGKKWSCLQKKHAGLIFDKRYFSMGRHTQTFSQADLLRFPRDIIHDRTNDDSFMIIFVAQLSNERKTPSRAEGPNLGDFVRDILCKVHAEQGQNSKYYPDQTVVIPRMVNEVSWTWTWCEGAARECFYEEYVIED